MNHMEEFNQMRTGCLSRISELEDGISLMNQALNAVDTIAENVRGCYENSYGRFNLAAFWDGDNYDAFNDDYNGGYEDCFWKYTRDVDALQEEIADAIKAAKAELEEQWEQVEWIDKILAELPAES